MFKLVDYLDYYLHIHVHTHTHVHIHQKKILIKVPVCMCVQFICDEKLEIHYNLVC
jgi:hypothetical protein